jgi:hypothetical protein
MCSIERSISSDSDSDELDCEKDAFSGNGQKRMQALSTTSISNPSISNPSISNPCTQTTRAPGGEQPASPCR